MTCKCGAEPQEMKVGRGLLRMQCACGRQSLPYSAAAKRKAAQLAQHANRLASGQPKQRWWVE
jgi:hypothetical protein